MHIEHRKEGEENDKPLLQMIAGQGDDTSKDHLTVTIDTAVAGKPARQEIKTATAIVIYLNAQGEPRYSMVGDTRKVSGILLHLPELQRHIADRLAKLIHKGKSA